MLPWSGMADARASASWRLVSSAVVGAVVLGLLCSGPALAAQDPAGRATTDPVPILGPETTDDGAKLTGEVADLRTRTSRTYVTDDGQRVARVFSESVNYRDDMGAWQPID